MSSSTTSSTTSSRTTSSTTPSTTSSSSSSDSPSLTSLTFLGDIYPYLSFPGTIALQNSTPFTDGCTIFPDACTRPNSTIAKTICASSVACAAIICGSKDGDPCSLYSSPVNIDESSRTNGVYDYNGFFKPGSFGEFRGKTTMYLNPPVFSVIPPSPSPSVTTFRTSGISSTMLAVSIATPVSLLAVVVSIAVVFWRRSKKRRVEMVKSDSFERGNGGNTESDSSISDEPSIITAPPPIRRTGSKMFRDFSTPPVIRHGGLTKPTTGPPPHLFSPSDHFFKDGQDPSTQPTPSPSVEDWDPDQVATWMRETGWDDKIVAGFHDQNLDGRLLLFLTDSALERVYGIMDETLRKVMIQDVDELRNSMHSQPSTSDGVRVRPVVKTQSEMAPPPYVAAGV